MYMQVKDYLSCHFISLGLVLGQMVEHSFTKTIFKNFWFGNFVTMVITVKFNNSEIDSKILKKGLKFNLILFLYIMNMLLYSKPTPHF